MLRFTLRCLVAAGTGLIVLMASPISRAAPVTIDYAFSALASPGRYEYRYTLTNDSLASPLAWFSIDFDTALYDESSLRIVSTGLGDWSEQILGSVLANPAQYDSYNTLGPGLSIGGSVTGFTVEFRWLGTGSPGSQAFTIYDPATLNVLETGVTTAVPEPTTVVLLLLGLGGLASAKRRISATRETSRIDAAEGQTTAHTRANG